MLWVELYYLLQRESLSKVTVFAKVTVQQEKAPENGSFFLLWNWYEWHTQAQEDWCF